MKSLLKSYLFWTYPRGSFHYDVMVTLILAFLFLSPRLINYRERPQGSLVSGCEVLVKTDGSNGLVYQIGAAQVGDRSNESKVRDELLKRIQAVSGSVQMDRYTEQKDASGRVTQYLVWAHR